ncbi:putative hspc200 [Aspergillus crustosus]
MSIKIQPSFPIGPPVSEEQSEQWLQAGRLTPPETIAELKAASIANDFSRFKAAFDQWKPLGYEIYELSSVMRTAVRHNDVQSVSLLISNGLDNWAGSYPIDAITHRAKDVLEYFLSIGWEINDRSRQGNFPMILGTAVKDEDMVRWLLDRGADPNQQSNTDMTATSLAVWDAPLSTLQLLFDRGADINKGALLHHAVERKSDEITFIAFLLDKGADINKLKHRDDDLSMMFFSLFMGLGTPLHDAAKLGKLHVVRYLLTHGADPTITDLKNMTPLDYAVKFEHPEVAEVLRSAMDRKRTSSL